MSPAEKLLSRTLLSESGEIAESSMPRRFETSGITRDKTCYSFSRLNLKEAQNPNRREKGISTSKHAPTFGLGNGTRLQ